MEYRPGIVPKLDVTIGEYEMSVVARSLCMNDGSLIIPTDKSTLMNIMASMNGPVNYELPDIRPQNVRKAIVTDMMAVLQSMKKTPQMKTIEDLLAAICKRVGYIAKGFFDVRPVFDSYKKLTFKSKMRQKRAAASKAPCRDFLPNLKSKLMMSLKELLSSSVTKAALVPRLVPGCWSSAELLQRQGRSKPHCNV